MPHVLHPRKSAKFGRFWADSKFSSRLVAWIKHLLKKKREVFLLKKRRRIRQKQRKTDRTPLRRRINLTAQTYDTEEVCIICACIVGVYVYE